MADKLEHEAIMERLKDHLSHADRVNHAIQEHVEQHLQPKEGIPPS